MLKTIEAIKSSIDYSIVIIITKAWFNKVNLMNTNKLGIDKNHKKTMVFCN